MDDNVMRRYTTPPTEARHYVQYDQGIHILLNSPKKILKLVRDSNNELFARSKM